MISVHDNMKTDQTINPRLDDALLHSFINKDPAVLLILPAACQMELDFPFGKRNVAQLTAKYVGSPRSF